MANKKIITIIITQATIVIVEIIIIISNTK